MCSAHNRSSLAGTASKCLGLTGSNPGPGWPCRSLELQHSVLCSSPCVLVVRAGCVAVVVVHGGIGAGIGCSTCGARTGGAGVWRRVTLGLCCAVLSAHGAAAAEDTRHIQYGGKERSCVACQSCASIVKANLLPTVW